PLANNEVSLLMHFGRYKPNGVEGSKEKVYDGGHCILTPGANGEPAQAKYTKIISRADDFNISTEVLPPKSDELALVEYPASLRIAKDSGGEALLLAALRDAGMAGQEIPDPLKEWRLAHPEFANSPFPQSSDRLTIAA
ncbi:MAG: hypothetical protein ACREF7_03045, partial [Candidatus Saccharimonadales bacterium]